MKSGLSFLSTCLLSILLVSCGNAKKLEQANNQVISLTSQVDNLNKKIADDQKLIAGLQQENDSYKKTVATCEELKATITRNLEAINRAIAEQDEALRGIMQKAEVSLQKFADAGIEVTYDDGFLRISMPDYLVFNSGSTSISTQGKDALQVVAEELAKYPNLNIYVVGNTDNVPANSKSKDNWTISTERANVIVRILKDDYNINPARLVAAGRSMYRPVADNATEEGRAKNRRTDIILNPDFSKILR